MRPGIVDQTVDEREVELAFDGFDPVPVNGRHDRVEVERAEFLPELPQVVEVRSRGVAQFAAGAPAEKRTAALVAAVLR